MTLDELNALTTGAAGGVLRDCCGSSVWVQAMVERRPFSSLNDALSASDDAWAATGEKDWLEAFAHHPRIGDTRAKGWAAGEQAHARDAKATVQEELARVNSDYEARFGHIYIVCATGRTAEEMLQIARARMNNDPATELAVAAAEQHKITQLRLRKLLGETT